MIPLALFQQVRALGVIFTPSGEGGLRYKAPKGALTPSLLAGLRQHKAEILDLVEEIEERAAIMEYDGELAREDADWLAWECIAHEDSDDEQF